MYLEHESGSTGQGQGHSLQMSIIRSVNNSDIHGWILNLLGRYVHELASMCRVQDQGARGEGDTSKYS